jgi:hypothetical protein
MYKLGRIFSAGNFSFQAYDIALASVCFYKTGCNILFLRLTEFSLVSSNNSVTPSRIFLRQSSIQHLHFSSSFHPLCCTSQHEPFVSFEGIQG